MGKRKIFSTTSLEISRLIKKFSKINFLSATFFLRTYLFVFTILHNIVPIIITKP